MILFNFKKFFYLSFKWFRDRFLFNWVFLVLDLDIELLRLCPINGSLSYCCFRNFFIIIQCIIGLKYINHQLINQKDPIEQVVANSIQTLKKKIMNFIKQEQDNPSNNVLLKEQNPQSQLYQIDEKNRNQQVGQVKTKKLYYKYCCSSCIHLEGSNKSCVCIVPRSKRKKTIGEEGCQTCSCRGCTAEDEIIRKEQQRRKKRQHRQRSRSRDKKFKPENGCCEKCIRALSKNRKACLCQVPANARKTKLPNQGCKLCGCNGCHPRDLNQKYEYSSDQDSDYEQDESLNIPKSDGIDNIDKSVIGQVITNQYNLYGPMLGLGIPQRTPSYILGRSI